MILKLRSKIIKHLYVSLLIAVVILIGSINYQPGTYLSGWDTLHPEFNFALNFKRLLFGVFRPEQGLGAVAAQSHMADLPRVVLLAVSSLIIPQNFLRYLFIVLYLLTGVLGVYFFVMKVLITEDVRLGQNAAFLGALFYLFNLGTLQHFVVVLEMFATLYAMLPWLFLAALSFLREGKTKHLFLFAVVSLLAAPMAHTATLWYVFLFIFILVLSSFLKNLKKVLILLGVLLAVNSFWLLPNLYFLKSSYALEVPQAKVNKIFSEEAFLHNQNRGNLGDLLVFKNFLFDWMIYSGPQSDRYDYLLGVWRKYLENRWIAGIGYLGAVSVFLGMFLAWRGKNPFAKSFLLPAVITMVFIMNNNPPFGFIFSFLKSQLPLFGEALRLPFTKFSILLMFFFAVFFAVGMKEFLSHLRNLRYLSNLSVALISLLLIIYCWPFFQGELISKYMQVKIPQEYFETFDWFDSQPEGRVLQLPLQTFWNWTYYSWGFQGAYFLPFGIKQPIFDRDFDRWNLSNERAFRELSYALYSQDPSLLKSALDKYQITYLLLDKNILAPGVSQDKRVLFYNETESLLSRAGDTIKLVKKFDNILVYQAGDLKKPIRVADQFTKIADPQKAVDIDWIYRDLGDYVSVPSNEASFSYPFYSLSDNQNFLTQDIHNLVDTSTVGYTTHEQYLPADLYAQYKDDNLTIKLIAKSARTIKDVQFNYPISQFFSGKNWLLNLDTYQTVILKDLDESFTYQGKVFLSTNSNNNLSLYPDVSGLGGGQGLELSLIQPEICQPLAFGQEAGLDILEDSLKLTAKNTSTCIKIPLAKFLQNGLEPFGNLLKINFLVEPQASDIGGHYCLFDKILNRCIKEKKNITAGQVVDYLAVNAGDLDKWDLVLYADNIGNLTEKFVVYKQLEVLISSPEVTWIITPEEIGQQLLGSTLSFEGKTILDFLGDMPGSGAEVLEEGHPLTSCSNVLPKTFNRVLDQAKGYVEYSALDGSSCDYFTFPNLPHNLGYFLSLETQNLSGLSLRVCFSNALSKRCDVFSAMPKNTKFTKDIIVIPPTGDGGAGYELHLDNYSIGSIPTVNRIRELKINPIPYYWLTKMNFKLKDEEPAKTSKMQVQSIRKILPSLFIVNLTNPNPDPGLLVFDSSFDPGWWANSGRHLLVNNWANGWLIEGSGQKQVVIFFWPQLLEFLGFALGGAIFLNLFRLLLTKRGKYD